MQTNKKNNYFIVTHQAPAWEIPFAHRIIGVEGYIPNSSIGISAGNVISKALDLETALGALRSLVAINQEIENFNDSDTIFWGSYRLFLSNEINKDWLSPSLQENKIISPSELVENWQNTISIEIPPGVDIMIPAPRILPDTLLGQYSRVHHLDDLLLVVGCAIRNGLLNPISVPKMLESNTLIPYGNFATSKKIRYEFNIRLWTCVLDFYKNYYIPRNGYQRRVIDFAFERVVSMAIIQLIIDKKLNCISCRNVWVSTNGVYIPSN